MVTLSFHRVYPFQDHVADLAEILIHCLLFAEEIVIENVDAEEEGHRLVASVGELEQDAPHAISDKESKGWSYCTSCCPHHSAHCQCLTATPRKYGVSNSPSNSKWFG